MNAEAPYTSKAPFIPAWLDDLGLPTADYRVISHLWRRRSKAGRCDPAVESIARVCRLSEDTVWESLKRLESKWTLLKRHNRPGKRNYYELIIPLAPTGNQGVGILPDFKGDHPPESKGQHLPETRGHKGSPVKVTPNKVCEGDPAPMAHTHLPVWFRSVANKHPSKDAEQCWKIFANHCRQKGRDVTPEHFDAWLEKEWVYLRKPTRETRSTPPEPKGWRESEVYLQSSNGNPESPLYSDSWSGLSPETQNAILRELPSKQQAIN